MADGQVKVNCPKCNGARVVRGELNPQTSYQCSLCGGKGSFVRTLHTGTVVLENIETVRLADGTLMSYEDFIAEMEQEE